MPVGILVWSFLAMHHRPYICKEKIKRCVGIAHLLFQDSIRLSANACISSTLSVRFILCCPTSLSVIPLRQQGIVSDTERVVLATFKPRWMELPHLSFDGKAKLSYQLTFNNFAPQPLKIFAILLEACLNVYYVYSQTFL
jgi:hypothetical protein